MRRKAIGYWFWLLGCFALVSCSSDIVYSHFASIPSENWHVDSVAQFDYTIDDAQAGYQMLIYVRHTERYPYQNMWLFINDGQRADTIEFYLADDRGRWLGDKHHGFIEMPVLMQMGWGRERRGFKFIFEAGPYKLSI